MGQVILFISALLMTSGAWAATAHENVLTLDKMRTLNGIPIYQYLRVTEDASASQPIDQVSKAAIQIPSMFSFLDSASRGYTSSVWWATISIVNDDQSPRDVIVEFRHPIQELDLFVERSDGTFSIMKDGIMEDAPSDTTLSAPYHHFELSLRSGLNRIFFRVRNPVASFNAFLWKPAEFVKYTSTRTSVYNLLFGALAALVIYNTLVLIQTRNDFQWRYTLYAGSLAIYNLYQSGYARCALGNYAHLVNSNFPMWFGLVMLMVSMTTTSLLETRSRLPIAHRYFKIFCWITVLFVAGSQFDTGRAFIFYLPFFLCTFLMCIAVGIITLRQGYRPSRYYLVSWVALAFIAILMTILNMGYALDASSAAPFLPLSDSFILVGSVAQLILLGIAAGDKIQMLEADLARKLAENRVYSAVSDAIIAHSQSLDTLLGSALDCIMRVMKYDRGCILLKNEETLRSVAYQGPSQYQDLFNAMEYPLTIEDDNPFKITNIFRKRLSHLVPDTKKYMANLSDESKLLVNRLKSTSFIVIALYAEDESLGVIFVDRQLSSNRLSAADLQLMQSITNQLALAIKHEYRRMDHAARQEREVESIRDSIHLREQFLANATHELKTPLNGIIGLAESLEDEVACRSEPRVIKSLKLMVASGRRLADLVDDVLSLAKSEHAARTVERSLIDVADICHRLTALLGPQFTKKGLSLTINLDRAASKQWIDGPRIEQVLTNLLSNALKFTERGRVEVDLSARGTTDVEVIVTDTGIGIAADDLAHIFEAYFQASGHGSRRAGGTGLGLAIARDIVRAHGGELEVSSRLGEGSRFAFLLKGAIKGSTGETGQLKFEPEAIPVARDPWLLIDPAAGDETGPGSQPRAIVAADIGREHILVVDDDETNLQVLVSHLTPLNYQVTTAQHGEQCLDLINGGLRPDLILLDVMMPGLNGYEVCRKLRERHSINDLPIIFLTARGQESDTLEALQAGGSDFVRKPFVKAELMARIALHSRLARYSRVTGRFVPWKGLEWLGYKSVLDIRLGEAVDMDLTVLFSDLRDFTQITELMPPRDIMRMINSYIGATAHVISDCGGMIDKFLGDGMMALFRSPADGIKAAVLLSAAVNQYNLAHRAGGKRAALSCRVALNSGAVTFGPVGYQDRLDITPISSMINAASRMDGLAKEYGASIIAAEAMVLAANVDQKQIPYRRLGNGHIRGQKESIPIVEILAGDPEAVRERKLASRTAFEACVHFLNEGSISRALEGFLALAQQYPEDQAIRYLLDRCQVLIKKMVDDSRAA